MTNRNKNAGFSILETLLVLVVIGILGFTGWYVYHARAVASKDYNTTRAYKSAPPNPYAGWKKYTSTTEKLSFKYPPFWKSVTPGEPSTELTADSFAVQSPTGAVTVSWDSFIDGIGGACDDTVMPGQPANNGPGPCAYWTVLDKQPLTGTNVSNLYYVDGVVTRDGSTYAPWCALEDSTGILQSESSLGLLLFKGKNNGQAFSGLYCGTSFDGEGLGKGTKVQATAALSNTDFKLAKRILMSATY